MFYFILTVTFAIYLNLHNFSTKKNQWHVPAYYAFALVVAAMAGLRGNEDEYTKLYIAIPDLKDFVFVTDSTSKEFIFRVIVSSFKYLSLGPQSIFIFFSSVAVIIHAVFFKRLTKFYIPAFFIYLCHDIVMKEFSGLRLGYASALVLPMIYYVERKNYVAYLLLYALSSFVQYVGLLSIIILFLNKKIKHIYLWGGLFLAIVLYKTEATSGFVGILDKYGIVPQIVSDYLGSQYHCYDAGIFKHPKTIQQLVCVIIMLFLSERYRESLLTHKSRYFNLVFNTYYVSTFLLITFSSHAIFAFRFGTHFAVVEPIIIGYMIWCFKEKQAVISALSALFLFVAYYNYIVLERLTDFYFFWSTTG